MQSASLDQEGAALIVEDHPLFLNALLELVKENLPRLHPIAVSSAEEGLKMARGMTDVRLVLLDPGLPGLNGAEAVTAFAQACPQANIAAISASEDRHQAAAVLRAGAKAMISKAASPEILRMLLYRLSTGQLDEPVWITPQGSVSLELESLMLTPRQREILSLLAQGHSNKEIGLRLDLAEITVKMHVSGIFKALGVANRTQAVMAAHRLGLLAA